MKLNRKTEPLVYKRVALKTNRIERNDGEQAINIAIAIVGFIVLMVLFVAVG